MRRRHQVKCGRKNEGEKSALNTQTRWFRTFDTLDAGCFWYVVTVAIFVSPFGFARANAFMSWILLHISYTIDSIYALTMKKINIHTHTNERNVYNQFVQFWIVSVMLLNSKMCFVQKYGHAVFVHSTVEYTLNYYDRHRSRSRSSSSSFCNFITFS